MSQPTTLMAKFAPAPGLLGPEAINLLGGPTTDPFAPFVGGMFMNGPTRALSLSEVWMAARRVDPSLHLTAWRHLLNVARLGVFVIPLRDDPAERTNILLSAQAVDNTAVAPGQVFSFNKVVGERTPEKGYQDGLMFSQGQVIRGTGGGICLVATGLYNAALASGLQLLERHPHSGLVGYAPPGCDASVVYGSEDMQFRNTTAAPIVIKTQADDDRIVVSLYGATPPPGRRVFVKATHLAFIHAAVIQKIDPTLAPTAAPVVVQRPRSGFNVTVERFFKQGKRTVRREVIVTEHRSPRPKIVHVPAPAPVPTSTVPGILPFLLPGAPATPPLPLGTTLTAPGPDKAKMGRSGPAPARTGGEGKSNARPLLPMDEGSMKHRVGAAPGAAQ